MDDPINELETRRTRQIGNLTHRHLRCTRCNIVAVSLAARNHLGERPPTGVRNTFRAPSPPGTIGRRPSCRMLNLLQLCPEDHVEEGHAPLGLEVLPVGRASREGTGTTNRIPSIAATRPPPRRWAKSIPAWRATRWGLAAV